MRRRVIFFTRLVILGWLLAGCLLAARKPDLSYNTSLDHVILYADIQPFPVGIPMPSTCRYDSIPTLRIWGDGLVFLDLSQYTATMEQVMSGSYSPTSLWSGRLSVEQIQALLMFLQGEGFFNHRWMTDEANPMGVWFSVGSQLKTGSEVYSPGDMNPPRYKELISKIQPSLTPFTLDNPPDPRFNTLHIGTRDCTPYVPPTPPPYTVTPNPIPYPPPIYPYPYPNP